MKTVIIQQIDGYNIIAGFDQPVIDPEATKKNVEDNIKDEQEFKELDLINSRLNYIKKNIEDLRNEFNGIISHAKKGMIHNILEIKENEKLTKIDNNIKIKMKEFNKLGEKKVIAMNNLDKKLKQLFLKNPIYFEPRQNEIMIKDDEYLNLKNIIDDNPDYKVGVKGNLIINKVGVKYIKDGKVVVISKLGEDNDGPLLSEISPDEFEIMRIKAMSVVEKESEMNNIIDLIAGQAAIMRSKLEIQCDDDALIKSRNWYDSEVFNIKEKYK